MSSVRSIMAARRLAVGVFRVHLPSTTRQSCIWSKLPNLINEKSVDWQKTRTFSGKSSVDWKKTTDLSGKWSALEYDEESWVRLQDALGIPDPKAAVKLFYEGVSQQEIIDKGNTVILKLPNPVQGGWRKVKLNVGQECVGSSPTGYKVKMFPTRQDNRLDFEAATSNGKFRPRVGYELQGDKLVFSMVEPGTGITAKMVMTRKSRADSEDGKSG